MARAQRVAPDGATGGAERRIAVLRSAMTTFARYGYARTSMEQVARDAGISRQGLYFLFASKAVLFREAAELTVGDDLAAAEHALAADGTPLRERLVHAFDHWAGRYVGPLARDVAAVVDANAGLAGPVVGRAPEAFARLVVAAVREHADHRSADRIARTLVSASIGIKHQVDDRRGYLTRLRVAVDVVLAAAPAPSGRARRT